MSRPPIFIEPLENRIAPASLLDARAISYTDGDGDAVTVKFSFDVFTGDATTRNSLANAVFKFSSGVVGDQSTGQVLQHIDFTKFPIIANKGSTVNGVGMTITSTQAGMGDGFVDVGAIKAPGVSLGKIIIDGDIGQIDAGGSGLKIGIASLTVKSIGARGIGTQIPVPTPTAENPAPDLVSTVTGEFGKLVVLDDIKDARIRIADGRNTQNQLTTLAKLGSVLIGGSLIGRTAAQAASDETGVIDCDRDIASAKIGTDAAEGITGGGGVNSGRIRAGGSITSLIISGDIMGGTGVRSGTISAGRGIGSLTIGDDLIGGAGADSGSVHSLGNFSSLNIAGEIKSGSGLDSAVVRALGTISKVVVTGNIDGTIAASGANSAGIIANGLPNILIKGGILGGAGNGTAFVQSGRTIGILNLSGDLSGGAGDGSGMIIAQGAAKNIVIGGKILGSSGQQSGAVRTGLDSLQRGTLASIAVRGSIDGGAGTNSGSIASGGDIKTVKIGTSTSTPTDVLKGGEGLQSGTVSAQGRISAITITGSLAGGAGDRSGGIFAIERTDALLGEVAGKIGSLRIIGNFTGGDGVESGRIATDGGIAKIVMAAMSGGSGSGSGSIQTGGGIFGTGNIGSITISGGFSKAETAPGAGSATILAGGKLAALSVGSGINGGSILVGDDLGTLTVGGDITSTTITARGMALQSAKADIAMGRISVRGNVTSSQFLAGYSPAGADVNPDAQIGTVTVGGNWTASDLVAGVAKGGPVGFGDPLNTKASGPDNGSIISRIASITIVGTATAADSNLVHAFTAQQILKMKVGSIVLPLDATPANQTIEIGGPSANLLAREIGI